MVTRRSLNLNHRPKTLPFPRLTCYTVMLKIGAIMVSYLMRQILIDALAIGPPYKVSLRPLHAMRQARILLELESRGLITPGPFPELTEAGVVEAEWFASIPASRSA